MAISRKLLNDGESIVVSTRTHPKALLLPVLILVVLVAIGVVFTVFVDNGVARLVAWLVLLVVALRWVLWPVLDWLTGTYTFTDRRLITRNGIITRRGHDIPLGRISDVSYERDIIDRVLGCGTLIISDASTFGQVRLHDIPDVEETQRRLNVLLHELHGDENRMHEGH